MTNWPSIPLAELFSIQKGKIGIKAATSGQFPLVTTGENHLSHDEAHFSGDAVCIPMISSSGHGHASIKRLHHIKGKFSVGSILAACVAKDEEAVSARYIYYYLSATKDTILIPLMKGSANVSLKLDDIAGVKVPLPPISIQHSIVAKLDELRNKSTKISEHLDAAEGDAERLLVSLATRPDLSDAERLNRGWTKGLLANVLHPASDAVSVRSDCTYSNIGLLSFARGIFAKPPIDGAQSSASTLFRVRSGQFIYSRLFAFEGAYAIVDPEHDGAFVSNEFPIFDIDPDRASREFLYAYFRSTRVWDAIAQGSKGLGDRRQRVQPSQVLGHELWLPPHHELHRINETVPHVMALKSKHADIRRSNARLVAAMLEQEFSA